MKITLSHQQPENISHNTVKRWERHLTRYKTLRETVTKKLRCIEVIRLFTGLLILASLAIIWEQQSVLEFFGGWGKWIIVGLLVGVFLYFFDQHKKQLLQILVELLIDVI